MTTKAKHFAVDHGSCMNMVLTQKKKRTILGNIMYTAVTNNDLIFKSNRI